MRSLDLTPMIAAMHERPGEFEMDGAWLKHRRSGHAFLIAGNALVRIEASCACAELSFDPNQAGDFSAALNTWSEAYWRPLQIERAAERRAAEINRQFAAHFRPPSRIARLRARVADAWRAAREELRRPDPKPLAIMAERPVEWLPPAAPVAAKESEALDA